MAKCRAGLGCPDMHANSSATTDCHLKVVGRRGQFNTQLHRGEAMLLMQNHGHGLPGFSFFPPTTHCVSDCLSPSPDYAIHPAALMHLRQACTEDAGMAHAENPSRMYVCWDSRILPRSK
jgi:hypothetical protein